MTNAMHIDEIGKELVGCPLRCEGIDRKPKEGIFPRCLILEKNGHASTDFTEPRCIVVGINPGIPQKPKNRSIPYEQEYYKSRLKDGLVQYQVLKDYFFGKSAGRTRPCQKRYYRYVRHFAKQIGLGDTILWTDMCKCQNKEKRKPPPPQTFGTCMRKFLIRELELFPNSRIIAVGN